jgi:hypothetical protein
MKKEVLLVMFLLVMIVSLSSVFAANNDSTSSDNEIDKGYTCLENAVKNKSVSLQEAIFASLALGSRSNIDSKISSEKKANADCWPKAGCTIKETAQVALVYDREGKNTDVIDAWLLTKNASLSDLDWYLEIDTTSHQNASCTVKYDSSASSSISRQINIGNDQKLTGESSNCFDISSNRYWLKINSNCYSKKFDVSCNKDFVTALAYFKSGGETMYVSSETHSQASNGTTTEEIKARCFKSNSGCDYEGSLWATLALSRSGEDVSAYLPYLIALADDNQRFFPSAFIYLINGGTDQFNNIIQSQKSSKYWEISGSPGRFYDTSLAMLALSSEGGSALDNAKNYLISTQDKNSGCWGSGNIRDTAFILYSGWTRAATSGGDGGGSSVTSCLSAGKECAKTFDCTNAGGSIIPNYQCPLVGEFCCSVSVQKQTCLQQKGEICSSNQVCKGGSSPASDGTCCLGTCQIKSNEDTCTAGEGICRESCDGNEEETNEVCPTSDNVCCKTKSVNEQKGFGWLWVMILIILIIIIAMAIVFRDKINIWLMKFKGGARTSPVRRGPPGTPGSFVGQRPMPNPGMFGRPGIPVGRPMPHPIMRSPQPTPRPQPRESNKEMEETLRKLKEMSK